MHLPLLGPHLPRPLPLLGHRAARAPGALPPHRPRGLLRAALAARPLPRTQPLPQRWLISVLPAAWRCSCVCVCVCLQVMSVDV